MAVWDRRDDESESDFLAFRTYRDQPAPRNLKRTAAALTDHTLADVHGLCAKFLWRERAKEWDLHLDKVYQAEREDFMKQTSRERAAEHLSLIKDAREALAIELRKFLAWTSDASTSKMNCMQPQQMVKWMETIVKLDRLIAGESTENQNQNMAFDLSGLSVDEIRALGVILDKANIRLPGLSTGAKVVS